jgi:hypothetical protein
MLAAADGGEGTWDTHENDPTALQLSLKVDLKNFRPAHLR